MIDMNILSGRNAHEILPKAIDLLFKRGVKQETRNGPVLRLPGVSVIEYERPFERVIFWPERDANPIFHLMESVGMLAGRYDLSFYANYAARMKEFSDDGVTLPASYGHRWRGYFGVDQIPMIVDELKKNQNSRRAVLEMWSVGDLEKLVNGTKDVCCNLTACFQINDEALDVTVFNRSNDVVWGALGANAVHFSVLLEYVAWKLNIKVGKYYQVSANLHGYLNTIEPLRDLPMVQGLASPYELGLKHYNIIADHKFERDLQRLDCGWHNDTYESDFFKGVVSPIQHVHFLYKQECLQSALEVCDKIVAEDWRMACSEWLYRRIAKRARKRAQDDGINYEQNERYTRTTL
jgi:hypothetical protein